MSETHTRSVTICGGAYRIVIPGAIVDAYDKRVNWDDVEIALASELDEILDDDIVVRVREDE